MKGLSCSLHYRAYTGCMTTQLAVRIESEKAEAMDALVASGRFPNRTEVVRAALDAFLKEERRATLARQLAESYAEIPADPDLDDVIAYSARVAVAGLAEVSEGGDDGVAAAR